MQLIDPTKIYYFPSFNEENVSVKMQQEMFKQTFNLCTELYSTSKIIKEESLVDFCTVYLNNSTDAESYVIYNEEKIFLNQGDLFLFNTKINIFPDKKFPQFFLKNSNITIFNWTKTHEIISL